jgi:hypothetical protein
MRMFRFRSAEMRRIDHTNDAVERHPSFSAPTLLIARLKLSAS